jgi:uncharacterized protein (TIGR03067 family)
MLISEDYFMKANFLLVAAVAALLVAAGQNDDAVKREVKALQGKWVADDGKGTLTFEGDKFTIDPTKGGTIKGTFKVDPTKKPKTIDFTITGGDKKFDGKTSLGIYELKDGKLKWCGGEPGKEDRPTEFNAEVDGKRRYLLMTFQRPENQQEQKADD